MIWLDYLIFGLYFATVLGIGFYFFLKNTDRDDYFVGSRNITAPYVGMSLVATDVGGGFSIGLGGLGFLIGLSGSWLLFTGLVGAWLVAVVMIPRIKKLGDTHRFLTYPDFLRLRYGNTVALIAAVISGIGYLGFTGAQILAGAKLAAGSIFADFTFMDPLRFSLYVMATVILLYTVLGGIKAVIYTNAVQWIILLGGLLCFGIPFALRETGGWHALKSSLPPAHFTLTNVSFVQVFNWFITIVPVWFVAMTLYQRVYACKNTREARKAFFIAGVLEYPLMAFMGVSLGLLARAVFPGAEAEMAVPMLLREVLPVGVTGIVLAAYFSAVMSTADSCLIAASGNLVNDLVERIGRIISSQKTAVRVSQISTLLIGGLALLIASAFESVLEIILYAYAFMVSGLLIPTLGAYFWSKSHPAAALAGMVGGGGLTLILIVRQTPLWLGLDASLFGICFSALLFIPISLLFHREDQHAG
ncbi:MAG TPA: sodium:solute symporter family protein [bacterium]|nr:sodium:solute symporter family protein [bacterium]